MPKSITATKAIIEDVHLIADAGVLTGITTTVNVEYGGNHVREQFDWWAELTAPQRTQLQAIYARLTTRVQATYIA